MTDPLGLTREQRAYSDASEELDRDSPRWWTKDYRDSVARLRAAEKLKQEDTVDKAFDYNSLACGFPDCEGELHLEWSLSRPLFVGDLAEPEAPALDDAAVETWRVLCSEGHVLLVPGPAACPCEAEECNHDQDTDEVKRFRAHDLVRLSQTLTAISYRPRWVTPDQVNLGPSRREILFGKQAAT